MAEPKPQDNSFDDLTEIEENIDVLYATYIRPIDSIRSKARPFLNVGSSKFAVENNVAFQKTESPNEPLESRVHAFYRMIGMPVVSKNSGYYSPGYNPLLLFNTNKSFEKRAKINKAVYEDKIAQEFIYEREINLEILQKVFSSQDSLSVILYSILYRYTFPFAILDPQVDHLEKDKQISTIENRQAFSKKFAQDNSSYSDKILSLGESLSKVFHPIKPFVVDPAIAEVVTPTDNIICVPFLGTEQQTRVFKNKALSRPGIELIIRQRLEDSVISENNLKRLQDILSGTTSNKATSQVDYNLLFDTVATLTENSELPNNFKEELSKVKNIEFNTSLKLIKTIKFLVKKLLEAQATLDNVRANINWLPVPRPNFAGPIAGGTLYTTYYKNGNYLNDVKLKHLEIKKLNAETESKEFTKLGSFASPFVQNSFSEKVQKYQKSISDLISSRDEFTEQGFNAIKTIEMIKGEITGMGLVDVLAFYIGLWTIDIKHLLYLIDDDSIERLWKYNPNYQGSSAVQDRRAQSASSQNVLDALKALEEKVFNVLKFADLYVEMAKNPTERTNSSV